MVSEVIWSLAGIALLGIVGTAYYAAKADEAALKVYKLIPGKKFVLFLATLLHDFGERLMRVHDEHEKAKEEKKKEEETKAAGNS